MRLYISGPMTGKSDFNFPAFHAAAKVWRELGWEVENPAEAFDGATDRPYKEYAERDIEALCACDAIAMLPGWDGPGARGSVWEEAIARRVFGLIMLDATAPCTPESLAWLNKACERTEFTHYENPGVRTSLPADAAARKAIPLVRGLLDYFPAALAEVAHVSQIGNDQHNPGEELHWARGKSMDQADCIVRHLLDRGTLDSDNVRHSAKVAWRALAMLQLELEAEGAPIARGAKVAKQETP